MIAVSIEGAEKLALVGKAVRKLGSDRTIVNNLSKRVRRLVGPVKRELKASAMATLPRHGGLNLWVAKAAVRVAVRRGEDTAGVDITAGRNSRTGRRSDLRRIDQGRLRHQTYGHRPWSTQSVQPGYFSTPLVDGPIVEEFQSEVIAAIDDAIVEVLHAF